MGYELVDLIDKTNGYIRRVSDKYNNHPDNVPYGGFELALALTEIHRALWAIHDKLEALSDEQ